MIEGRDMVIAGNGTAGQVMPTSVQTLCRLWALQDELGFCLGLGWIRVCCRLGSVHAVVEHGGGWTLGHQGSAEVRSGDAGCSAEFVQTWSGAKLRWGSGWGSDWGSG
jgi:hypothetical protein